MAVAFDSVGTGIGAASRSNGTYTHTVSSSGNITVLCAFFVTGSGSNPSSTYQPAAGGVTFGGIAMSPYAVIGNNNVTNATGFIFVYALFATGLNGAKTVSITTGTTCEWWADSCAYTGVSQISQPYYNWASSTNPATGSVMSDVGHMAFSVQGNLNGTMSAAGSGTKRANFNGAGGVETGWMQDIAGAAPTVTMSVSAATAAWCSIAVDMSPANFFPMF